MKIVNIILTSQNGGAEQVFLDYCQILLGLGHEVVAIVKNDAPYIEILEKNQIKTYKINNRFGFYDFFASKKIAEILQAQQAVAVIAHIGRAMVLTNKALKKLKKSQNSKQLKRNQSESPLFYAVNHSDNVKRSLLADFIISTNSQIFYRTCDLGRNATNSFIIPNAIETADALNPDEININFSTKQEIVIGALGRFDRTKGFDCLIEAIALLKRQFSEKHNEKSGEKFGEKSGEKLPKKFLLKIAGAGYFEDELRKLIADLKLENEVQLVGWIKDKKQFFAGFDIFCLPSLNEPFGLVLLEAMKFTKPIIATDADGPKEILRDGVDALIVSRSGIDIKNYSITQKQALANSLAKSIEKLAFDDDLANNLVRNAAKKLQQLYSMESLSRNLAELFGAKK